MKAFTVAFLVPVLLLAQERKDYPVRPVPFTAVKVTDSFWAPKIDRNRTVSIPHAFAKDEETGRMDNFMRAAQALRGETLTNKTAPGFPFDDTDVYKVLEGAAYALAVQPDKKLEAYCDDLIVKIGAAQEKDGYLYTTRSIDPQKPHEWAGKERWVLETDLSHELYNLGHLYEAAAAYYQATGKKNLLEIALKTADLLDKTFGPGKRSIWPGHQIAEMGLVKLYRVTSDERYLKLAKFLLDERGPGTLPMAGKDYNQSFARVVDQSEAIGHAVRATYMYSGMADVAALTGDASYIKAMERIWENVVSKKLYITGGIGATSHGEAFGANYELPNMSAYNETCAAIGNDYWNHRLFLLHADAKYIDVMERTLYNGLISGVSLDGKTFFYPNPLESNGQHARSEWFGCACCPGNMTRFLASVPGYVYAQKGESIWVNLYMGGTGQVTLDSGRKVQLVQQTEYPWKGNIRIQVTPEKAGAFTLQVRIPGWARNQVVPSDLYRYVDAAPAGATLKVNGKPVPLKIEKGYVALNRAWKAGDVIELELPMAVRRVAANDQVAADRGRIALERGPLVYALEWPDNAGVRVRNLLLDAKSEIRPEHQAQLLDGVTVLKGKAFEVSETETGLAKRAVEFTAIPYYAWANRGKGQMAVWVASDEKSVKPAPRQWPSMQAKVTSSGKKNPRMVQDGEEPGNSAEPGSYFDWWPLKGKTEWMQYEWPAPVRLSEARVYFFDDTGRGEVRVPASWRLLYRDGEEWKPVAAQGAYGTAKDGYNVVKFAPVETKALKIEIGMQERWSAGIQEWKVQ